MKLQLQATKFSGKLALSLKTAKATTRHFSNPVLELIWIW